MERKEKPAQWTYVLMSGRNEHMLELEKRRKMEKLNQKQSGQVKGKMEKHRTREAEDRRCDRTRS